MNEMPKVVVLVLNSLISIILTYKGWGILLFSEYKLQMLLVAVVGAMIGTICAAKREFAKNLFTFFLALGAVFALAIFSYSRLLAMNGNSGLIVLAAFFLILIIFGIAFYLFTYFELYIIGLIKKNVP